MLRRLLEFLAPRLFEERRITIGGQLYMRRFYLFGQMSPRLAELWNCGRKPRQRLGFLRTTYLHCIHRPDADRFCHNHPWSGGGRILTGGYVEQRYAGDPHKGADVIVHRFFKPGARQELGPNTFHRIHELLEDVCWTLFWAHGKSQSWGYWHDTEKRFIPWRELHGLDSNSDPSG